RELPRRFRFALPGVAPAVPSLGQNVRGHIMLGEGVENHAGVGRVEKSALLELALYFDEAVTELAQQPDARRLGIDASAAAPVGAELPAQYDRLAVGLKPGLPQDRTGRMVASDRE